MTIPAHGFRNLNEMAAYMRLQDKKINALESAYSAVQMQGGGPASLPGQYTGKIMPTTEGAEIVIPTNANLQQNNIVLTADGPFTDTLLITSG